jgi:cytochrome c556
MRSATSSSISKHWTEANMRRRWFGLGLMLLTVCLITTARAHEGKRPPGPIHDRHELMEGIGRNAKAIGNALKAHDLGAVADAAGKIQTDAAKVAALFPPGSTHPASRAKPEIWTNWDKFEAGTKQLEAKSGALAAAAKSGGDVAAASDALFDTCKGCHDQFRVPEKKKK